VTLGAYLLDMSPPPRVRFPPDDGFHAAVKRRAAALLVAAGRAPRGAGVMHAKTAIILAWFAGSYACLLRWGGASVWLGAALTLSLALAMAGIGFSVMHDANHGAYSRSARVNWAWGLSLDLVGASSYVWRFRHNVLHHTYPNIDGMDVAIDAGVLIRFAPTQPLRGFHRWQHVYAWPLYGLIAMKWWLVDDFVDVLRGRTGPFSFPRPRGRELAAFVAGKVVFLGWSAVIPVLVYRSGWVALPFLAGGLTLGLVLSTVFQLAHVMPDVEFHVASPGRSRMATGWAEHQVRATLDFAPSNRLLGWYVGGLNYQIEHHLLPDVCHVNYPALAGVVAETCREHGVPYRTLSTLRAAIAHHQTFLRTLGKELHVVPGHASAVPGHAAAAVAGRA
jgi:linoleoyl-CoA desaturase